MAAVAHVSFFGGGIFLPDHGPGDRQTILDYVSRLLRSKQKVQILLDSQRWLARSGDHAGCERCGHVSTVSCREAGNEAESYCLRCALTSYPPRPKMNARATTPRHLTLEFAQA